MKQWQIDMQEIYFPWPLPGGTDFFNLTLFRLHYYKIFAPPDNCIPEAERLGAKPASNLIWRCSNQTAEDAMWLHIRSCRELRWSLCQRHCVIRWLAGTKCWEGSWDGSWDGMSALLLGRWLGHVYIILLLWSLESAIQSSLLIRNNHQPLTDYKPGSSLNINFHNLVDA